MRFNLFARVEHNGFRLFGIAAWPRWFWLSHHVLLGTLGGLLALTIPVAYAFPVTIVLATVNKYLWWNWQLLDDRRLVHFHQYLLDDPLDFLSDQLLAMLGTVLVPLVLVAAHTHDGRHLLIWLGAAYLTSTFNGT